MQAHVQRKHSVQGGPPPDVRRVTTKCIGVTTPVTHFKAIFRGSITPTKINIEPENHGLEDVSPFPGGPYSQVPAVNLPPGVMNLVFLV